MFRSLPEAVAAWKQFIAVHSAVDKVTDDDIGVYLISIERAERERCAKMVEDLRGAWFHEGVPGDLAVPAGALARSMRELAEAMRDPTVKRVETNRS